MQSIKCNFVAMLSAVCLLTVRAVAQTTSPVVADTLVTKTVRDLLLDWDRNCAKWTLEQQRKIYHTDNEKDASYLDFVAHEAWEESKAQQAVRDKWGPQAEATFLHYQGGSTLEDDQVCEIKVDGDRAVASWPDIKGSSPVQLTKVDGHWMVDGHAIYQDAVKDDPTKAPPQAPTGKLMKQVVADITAGKFDDFDSFFTDFKAKYGEPPNGN